MLPPNSEQTGIYPAKAIDDKYTLHPFYGIRTLKCTIDCNAYVVSNHKIAHNRLVIIDKDTLITGSFNFSKAAEESNAENLLILKGNKHLVDTYIQNFEAHKGHSEGYAGR